MQDQQTAYEPMQESHTLRNVLLAVAILFVIGSSILMYSLYGRLGALEVAQKQAADDAAAHNEAIMKKLGITQANVEAEAKALASQARTNAERCHNPHGRASQATRGFGEIAEFEYLERCNRSGRRQNRSHRRKR